MEAAFFERTGYLSASDTRDGETDVVETQAVSLSFCVGTLYKYGRFSLLWINLIFILHSNGQLREQLKEEQLGYSPRFNPSQTSFATVGKSLSHSEFWFICKLGKIFLSCLTVVLGPNTRLSDFFKDHLCAILLAGTLESLVWM